MQDAGELDEIRSRMKTGFTNFYFTLLSIIQGTALAALFVKVDALVNARAFHATQAVLAFAIFLVIVNVWNQYQMGLMLHSWIPTIFDAFIPFSLGVFEFAMITGMEHSARVVLLINGLFFLVGISGFEHQYRQVRKGARPDALIHRIIAGFRATDNWFSIVSMAVLLLTAALISGDDPDATNQLAGAFVMVAVGIAHAAREAYQWSAVQRRLARLTDATAR